MGLKRVVLGKSKVCALAFAVVQSLSLDTRAQQAPLIADGGFAAQALQSCQSDLQLLNQITGWQNAWPPIWLLLRDASAEETAKAVQRWSDAPKALDEAVASLRASIGTDRMAPAPVVARVIEQTESIAAALDRGDLAYLSAGREKAHASWNRLIAERIAPAFRRYVQFLRDEYLPAAPTAIGLSSTPGGAACFGRAVSFWTSLSLTPDKIEAIGRRILKDSRSSLEKTLAPGETLGEALEYVRQGCGLSDTTREDIVRISERAIERATAAQDRWFAHIASTPIVVEALPTHLEGSYPAGYYRTSAGEDAAGKAAYVVNTSRPVDRRAMAETIAFHEAIPGHHLHFTYPRDGALGFNAAHMEGWGIYAEYLSDEAGLYTDKCSRRGMIAKHLWAASRLVIEPGIHLRGWSREEAVAFMLSETALPREEVEIEIDRYIAMPAHSLSYILGYEAIASARAKAKRALGDRFDIREFHHVILSRPARPLTAVQGEIDAWIEAVLQRP